MSAAGRARRFVWRALWRKARRAAQGHTETCPVRAHVGRCSPERALGKVQDLGGMGPAAVGAVLERGSCDPLENSREAQASALTLFRAWRAHGLSGGALGWADFQRDWRARSVAMQALASARRAGAPLDSSLPRAAADVLLRWGQS